MAVVAGVANSQVSSGAGNTDFARSVMEFNQVTLPSDPASAVIFDFSGFSGGSIELSGACTITWYASSRSKAFAATTPTAAYNGAEPPVAIVQTIPGAGVYELPLSLFGKPMIAPIVSSGTPPLAVVSLKR